MYDLVLADYKPKFLVLQRYLLLLAALQGYKLINVKDEKLKTSNKIKCLF